MLAQFLARMENTRPDAEQILNSMMAQLHDDPNHIVGLRAAIMTELVDFEIVDYVHAHSADQRKALMDQIQQQLDQLIAAAPAEIQVAPGTYRSGIGIDLRREQCASCCSRESPWN